MKKSIEPKYPDIKVKICVKDDNAFLIVWALMHYPDKATESLNHNDAIFLLMQVQEAMNQNNVSRQDHGDYLRQAGNDLDNILQISMRWVDIDFDF